MPMESIAEFLVALSAVISVVAVVALLLALITGAFLVPIAPTVRDERLDYFRCFRIMFNAHMLGMLSGLAAVTLFAYVLPYLAVPPELRHHVDDLRAFVRVAISAKSLILFYAVASFMSVALVLRYLRPTSLSMLIRGLSGAVFVTAVGNAIFFAAHVALGLLLIAVAARTIGADAPR